MKRTVLKQTSDNDKGGALSIKDAHHFICPYNDTSAFCSGYDAALWFETSDQ